MNKTLSCTRRRLMSLLTGGVAIGLLPVAPRLSAADRATGAAVADGAAIDWAELGEAEWRRRLTPEAFRVLRKEGTERPFTSPLDDEKRAGTFVCAGCALPLFRSETKYDSGTGWPSFWTHIDGALGTKRDFMMFLPRTEYHCIRCKGHQGHVFDDGPRPTGKRYCNNGVALDFVADAAGDASA